MKIVKTISLLFLLFIFSIPIESHAQMVVKKKPIVPKEVGHKPKLPQKGMVWINGFWRWDQEKNTYVRCKGHYVKPKPGHKWSPGKWKSVRKGYKWIPGRWKKIHSKPDPAKIN